MSNNERRLSEFELGVDELDIVTGGKMDTETRQWAMGIVVKIGRAFTSFPIQLNREMFEATKLIKNLDNDTKYYPLEEVQKIFDSRWPLRIFDRY